ncbi:MAG: ATP-binding cassette domain-containing protein, partial [Halobacteriovoraceae bacterium]|nr:ATP-binding cassette domain-containing protein [Halobacteriovoraceae bacterium]
VYEFLQFICQIRNLNQIKEKIQLMIDSCALDGVKYQRIETLSKGYKRRVSLAQALIHNPPVLILDEPTDGLDPNQKHDVRNLIKNLSKEKCILISTHILEEVEAVCNRCIIIGEGRKLFEGTPQELKQKSSKEKIEDVFRAITTGQKVEGVGL